MSSDTKPNTASADGEGEIRNPAFAMHPPLPLEIPVFVWPIRPLAALKWLASQHYPFVIALSVFAFLPVAISRTEQRICGRLGRTDFLVNLAILVAVAGGLHLYLYTFRKQGDDDQYDTRPFPTDSKLFWGKNQVWDNVFYSCVSGVTIWTAYQSLFMWLYANDKLPWTDFASNPVLVRGRISDPHCVGTISLLLDASLDALEAAVQDFAHRASPQQQCRAVVGHLHESGRARDLFQRCTDSFCHRPSIRFT